MVYCIYLWISWSFVEDDLLFMRQKSLNYAINLENERFFQDLPILFEFQIYKISIYV